MTATIAPARQAEVERLAHLLVGMIRLEKSASFALLGALVRERSRWIERNVPEALQDIVWTEAKRLADVAPR